MKRTAPRILLDILQLIKDNPWKYKRYRIANIAGTHSYSSKLVKLLESLGFIIADENRQYGITKEGEWCYQNLKQICEIFEW